MTAFENSDNQHCPCSKCGGTDRFRVIDLEVGALFYNPCFSTRNGDGIAAVQWLNSDNFPRTVNRIADYLGITNGEIDGNGKPDIVADIARRKRVPLDAWKAFGAHEAKRGKLTVCRLPMYDEQGQHCSDFDLATLDDKWLKGMTTKGKPAGLFFERREAPAAGRNGSPRRGAKRRCRARVAEVQRSRFAL